MTTERNQAVGVETVCSDSERDADTSDFSHISIHLVPNTHRGYANSRD